jgi:predicted negative regulator of RcsB-dependent stress response
VVDIHATEEEQLNQIKTWFKENGKYLVAGVLLGAGSIIGYRSWDSYQTELSRSASAAYEDVRDAAAAGNTEQARELGSELIQEYPSSPYATHTALSLAVVALDAGDTDEAVKQLAWVLDGDARDSLKHVARLRLARVQLYSQNKAQVAIDTLEGHQGGEFAPLYDELRGDAWLALADEVNARAAYQAAIDSWDPDLGSAQLLQMKLDDLAVAE